MPDKGTITRVCEQCGAHFQTYPSRVRTGKGRFCSKACLGAAQRVRITLSCKGCGSPFQARPGPGHPRYCSPDCLLRFRAASISRRFTKNVDSSNPDGCWPWQGCVNVVSGYGQMNIDRRPVGTHRVAWTLATGQPVPKGRHVLHACDNRPCARNDDVGVYVVDGVEYPRRGHLFLGDRIANIRDMIAKGRVGNHRLPHKRNR